MQFIPTELPGVFIVDVEPRADDRGLFARTFCAREFESHGLGLQATQTQLEFCRAAGSVRGLHYRVGPGKSPKLVRCTGGALFHVAVDMRPESATYLRYLGVELNAENRRALLIPPMVADGYQTLIDGTEATWLAEEKEGSSLENGLRHDDPAIGIRWPRPALHVHASDAAWPLLNLVRKSDLDSIERQG